MITHVLDSSAWLAHVFDEPGGDKVTILFEDPGTKIAVSVLSILEVHTRFCVKGRAVEFFEMLETYRQLFDRTVSTDEVVVLRALALRERAAARLPAIDSLIAATAAHHGAILVHRDPHFLALAGDEVKQQLLEAEG